MFIDVAGVEFNFTINIKKMTYKNCSTRISVYQRNLIKRKTFRIPMYKYCINCIIYMFIDVEGVEFNFTINIKPKNKNKNDIQKLLYTYLYVLAQCDKDKDF